MAHKYRARLPSLLMMRSIPFSLHGERTSTRDVSECVGFNHRPAGPGVQAVNAISTERPSASRSAPPLLREAIVSITAPKTLAGDELRWSSRCSTRCCIGRAEGEPSGLPFTLTGFQNCRPALAGIIGARLEFTAAMISSVSIPCR
jgi:hypothetical protein